MRAVKYGKEAAEKGGIGRRVRKRQNTESETEEKRNKHDEKGGNNEQMKRCGPIEVKRDDWRESFCHFPGSTYQMSLNRSLHFPLFLVSQKILSKGRHNISLTLNKSLFSLKNSNAEAYSRFTA